MMNLSLDGFSGPQVKAMCVELGVDMNNVTDDDVRRVVKALRERLARGGCGLVETTKPQPEERAPQAPVAVLPLAYRPREHDQRGQIRDATGMLVAVARWPGFLHDSIDKFNAAGIDPCRAMGEMIVRSVNMLGRAEKITDPSIIVAMLEALENVAALETERPKVDFVPSFNYSLRSAIEGAKAVLVKIDAADAEAWREDSPDVQKLFAESTLLSQTSDEDQA